jgi:hypothetical protein
MLGVMERLAEEGHIGLALLDRQLFEVAQAVFQILDAVSAREARTELDHLFGIVDGDYSFGAAREQLGDGAFSGAQVGDHQGRHQQQEGFRQALPGASRHVLAAEFSGQLIEIGSDFILPPSKRQAKSVAVFPGLGNFLDGVSKDAEHLVLCTVSESFQAI